MAFANYETKEISCKIGYFGPKGSGKSASFQSIYECISPQIKSGVFELSKDHHSCSFDFLPLSLGLINDYRVRLHLFSIPLVSFYDVAPMVMLRGLDGYVLVLDAQVDALVANVDAIAKLKLLFDVSGLQYTHLPRIVQYNKADLVDKGSLKIIRQELTPIGIDDFTTVAVDSLGTMDTLDAITKKVLKNAMV